MKPSKLAKMAITHGRLIGRPTEISIRGSSTSIGREGVFSCNETNSAATSDSTSSTTSDSIMTEVSESVLTFAVKGSMIG